MKRALLAVLAAFVATETVLVTWAVRTRTWEAALAALHDPLVLIMLVDFSFFAGVVFFWMVADAKKRGQNGWIWLPAIILAPTAALTTFLLLRPVSLPDRGRNG